MPNLIDVEDTQNITTLPTELGTMATTPFTQNQISSNFALGYLNQTYQNYTLFKYNSNINCNIIDSTNTCIQEFINSYHNNNGFSILQNMLPLDSYQEMYQNRFSKGISNVANKICLKYKDKDENSVHDGINVLLKFGLGHAVLEDFDSIPEGEITIEKSFLANENLENFFCGKETSRAKRTNQTKTNENDDSPPDNNRDHPYQFSKIQKNQAICGQILNKNTPATTVNNGNTTENRIKIYWPIICSKNLSDFTHSIHTDFDYLDECGEQSAIGIFVRKELSDLMVYS